MKELIGRDLGVVIMMSRTGVEGSQAVIVSAARTPIGRAGERSSGTDPSR